MKDDFWCEECSTRYKENCSCPDVSNSSGPPGYMSWPDVAWVVKWAIKNTKHLEPDDTYLTEKEVDRCHSEYMKMKMSDI